jgi:hypothetical protein
MMQEIADWLKTLGMSEYVGRFAESGINISVLRHLTDRDLKDIGVLLGHRRKMLAAIAELGRTIPAAPQPRWQRRSPKMRASEWREPPSAGSHQAPRDWRPWPTC